MAKPSGPPLPAILVANDLLDGEVLFRSPDGWSKELADALVALDGPAAERLEAEGQAATRRQEVVEAYLVEIEHGREGLPVPRHYRERIKTLGPSHRLDLGKQAKAGQGGRKITDVSL